MSLLQQIKSKAVEIGFSACGIAPSFEANSETEYFDKWIAAGNNAGMEYMKNNRDIRINPDGLVPGAKSVISVALNYYPKVRRPENEPHIAYYAYGKDYHIVVKEMLRRLWNEITHFYTGDKIPEARVFTDSAPILERYWAWRAGLGWIGKNTNLIIPGKGSFFFLGEIVTTWELGEYDSPMPSKCGNCRRCLDACPTKALAKEHELNANRCLSYLTIEHRGDFPEDMKELLGNRLYGCDTCQKVCPWNRFASPTNIDDFYPSKELLNFSKESLQFFSEEDYKRIFAKSAVKRVKYEGMMRTIEVYLDNLK